MSSEMKKKQMVKSVTRQDNCCDCLLRKLLVAVYFKSTLRLVVSLSILFTKILTQAMAKNRMQKE